MLTSETNATVIQLDLVFSLVIENHICDTMPNRLLRLCKVSAADGVEHVPDLVSGTGGRFADAVCSEST